MMVIMSNTPRLAAANRDWGRDETGCTVLHIDMDAFYASLEIARHPEYSGKPVIIGTGTRSVVSAASYEARRYGVNSAMATARARQLCPDGIYLPVDMIYYRRMSRRIFREVFGQITDAVEQVSVDEGYMDVSAALMRWKRPTAIAAWIREQVYHRFSITCSVGIATNKLVAKMASTNAKPDGMLLIPRTSQAPFVQMMPLRAIPGIGPAMARRLGDWGVTTVKDLAVMNQGALEQAAGSRAAAHTLFLAARGIDDRKVTPRAPEKSIGSERTFAADTRDVSQVSALLHRCCDDVASSLRSKRLLARTLTVKLRFADLHYATRAHTMASPVDTTSALYPEALALLWPLSGVTTSHDSAGTEADGDEPMALAPTLLPRQIRLAGISVSGLSTATDTPIQPSLEDLMEEARSAAGTTKSARLRGAEQALDAVRRRYGAQAAGFGTV